MLISELNESLAFELIDLTRKHKHNELGMRLLEIRQILRIICSKISAMEKKTSLKYKIVTRLDIEQLRLDIQKLNTMIETSTPRQMTVPQLFYLAKRIKLFISKYSLSLQKLG